MNLNNPDFPSALCAQTDPEIFFPQPGSTNTTAKKICGECFHKAECLDYAIENKLQEGIWGGHSHLERLRIARARRAA